MVITTFKFISFGKYVVNLPTIYKIEDILEKLNHTNKAFCQ